MSAIEWVYDIYKKDIKDIFTQVFYDSLGYFGRDLRVARFEKKLDIKGDLGKFKEAFYKSTNLKWEEYRDAFYLFDKEIIASLELIGYSKQSAESKIYRENTETFSIDSLVKDIKEYVDSMGQDFRLIFMVDEIGLYIGEDMDLTLNFKLLINTLCRELNGKVWIICTNQETDDFFVINELFNMELIFTPSTLEGTNIKIRNLMRL